MRAADRMQEDSLPLCRGCGYCLRGLDSAVCPECALPFDISDPTTFTNGRTRRHARWRRIATAVGIAGLMCVLGVSLWYTGRVVRSEQVCSKCALARNAVEYHVLGVTCWTAFDAPRATPLSQLLEPWTPPHEHEWVQAIAYPYDLSGRQAGGAVGPIRPHLLDVARDSDGPLVWPRRRPMPAARIVARIREDILEYQDDSVEARMRYMYLTEWMRCTWRFWPDASEHCLLAFWLDPDVQSVR